MLGFDIPQALTNKNASIKIKIFFMLILYDRPYYGVNLCGFSCVHILAGVGFAVNVITKFNHCISHG